MPSATAIAQASASAAIVVPAIRLLQSFAAWPAPWPPTWTTRLPSSSKSGRARSNASASPPTMIVRVASVAPRGPPLTGASRTSSVGALGGESPRERGRARRHVDEERSRSGACADAVRAQHRLLRRPRAREARGAPPRSRQRRRQASPHASRRAPRPASDRRRSPRARVPRREAVAPSAAPSSRGRSRRSASA